VTAALEVGLPVLIKPSAGGHQLIV
jgi:biotin carboxylase